MRRHSRSQPARFLSRAEGLRLISLVFMLAIIGLTIYRYAPRNRAAGPAPMPVAGAPSPAAAPTAAPDNKTTSDTAEAGSEPLPGDSLSTAIPDEESPAEVAALARDAQAVMDLATEVHPTEMPAYSRLLDWAERLTPAAEKRAATISFHDLIKKPNANRGRLLHVRLRVRRVQSYPLPSDGAEQPRQVYELWGWPEAANGWLYVVVTPSLPPGFPTEFQVDQTVDVYGYFFKLQGYHPADAKPNARPLAAPLVIGRVQWLPAAARPPSAPIPLVWAVGVGIALTALVLYWAWPRRKAPSTSGGPPVEELPEIDSDRLRPPDDIVSQDWIDDEEEPSDFHLRRPVRDSESSRPGE